jgi:hypothetical protein
MLPEQLDLVGLAALTAVAVAPWLVVTVWSAERRSRTAGGTDRRPGSGDGKKTGPTGSAGPLRAKHRALLAVATILVATALIFPASQPVVALALTLLAANFLPWLVVRVVERFERSSRSPRI